MLRTILILIAVCMTGLAIGQDGPIETQISKDFLIELPDTIESPTVYVFRIANLKFEDQEDVDQFFSQWNGSLWTLEGDYVMLNVTMTLSEQAVATPHFGRHVNYLALKMKRAWNKRLRLMRKK